MTTRLMQGSEAVAEAALAAGCRFFSGYPMTPFTELLENMGRKLPGAGGVCMNAASEIEAVNMTIGAAATGARAATGSCGQGLALMQEGIAELALNELPAVIFNMARGQQDYFQATRGGGWGDYRTITLAPRDVPEAVEHTQLLFYLADRYRTPVVLYGDYVIAHSTVGIDVQPIEFPATAPKDWALDGSMSGTGRARQIWTWALGKPNTPGPGPNGSWELIAEKYDQIGRAEARHEAYRTDDADVVLTLKTLERKGQPKLKQIASDNVPIYSIKTNTTTQIQSALRDVFNLGSIDHEEIALREAEEAVYQVLLTNSAIELSPQTSYVRRMQHQLAEKYRLQSRSTGLEPNRRVRIFKIAD